MKTSPPQSANYQETAVTITAVLAREFGSAYFVGGTVRDMLLGRESNDIDIATSATPIEIKKVLKKLQLPIITIGEKFGTIRTIVDTHAIEITTFRSESAYRDSRHPSKLKFVSTAKDDSRRRDFTINGLYFDPTTGELLDFHHGLEDLRANTICFIGDPKKRITEDPLRMLRAVRFATTLGLTIESVSKKAITQHAESIVNVPAERVRDELDKIIANKNYHSGFVMLDALGLLPIIFPEVDRLKTVKQSRNYHAEGNVFIHTMRVLGHATDRCNNLEQPDENEITFRYALLFHDLGKYGTAMPTTRDGRKHISFPQHGPIGSKIFLNIAKRLKFSTKRTKQIAYLISHHMDLRNIHDLGTATMAAWLQKPMIPELIRLRFADNGGAIRINAAGKVMPTDFSELKRFEKQFLLMHKRFAKNVITGDDIMRTCKIKSGAEVGEILQMIRLLQGTGEIKNRAQALTTLSKIKNHKNS